MTLRSSIFRMKVDEIGAHGPSSAMSTPTLSGPNVALLYSFFLFVETKIILYDKMNE